MSKLKELWKIFGLPPKDLKSLTDKELIEILEKYDEIDIKLVTVVCAECLRRTWGGK